MSDTTTVVTGDGVELQRQITVMYGLALEINSGLKVRRGVSLVKLANAISGGNGRTKKQALRDLVASLKETNPRWEPGGRVKAAMR